MLKLFEKNDSRFIICSNCNSCALNDVGIDRDSHSIDKSNLATAAVFSKPHQKLEMTKERARENTLTPAPVSIVDPLVVQLHDDSQQQPQQ